MSLIARFAEYAAAFEKAFESDDWTIVEPYFTEAAVYVVGMATHLVGGPREGRDEITKFFRQFVNGFDRRFESRELTLLEGPREEGDSVWIRGIATYRSPGVPDFVLELEETVTFEDGRISRLEDSYTPDAVATLEAYLDRHGDQLGIRMPG